MSFSSCFQIPFGMWLMALLVNSSTLDEMIIIWRNICIVLISPNQNDQFKMSISALSKLAEKMNGDPDKTNFVLKNVLVTTKGQFTSAIDIDVSNKHLKFNMNLSPQICLIICLLYIYIRCSRKVIS